MSPFRRSNSGDVARERLRVVLMQDRISLAPHLMERMKEDLVDVISRYVDVDRGKIEVQWRRADGEPALVANIPVRSVKRSVASNDRASERVL
ncbi:MAG: cell division topological specificity factor MinE [Firmicutes bacterium]|nr:cell division topological specificity factor MinE [Candidatus Fermentithermobacillaceae bacterium]